MRQTANKEREGNKMKQNQRIINAEAKEIYDYADRQYISDMKYRNLNVTWKRLNNCQAWTYENEDYIYLMSYNTIVAVFEKETCELADVLRMVYGYTATSAQHIAKFANYLKLRFGYISIQRWY